MLYKSIITFIEKHQLIMPDRLLLVGLSGGPDSVFLLHLLVRLSKKIALPIVAAHLDHGWRPDSEKDMRWCQELCKKLGVAFIAQHARNFSESVRNDTGSQEEQGRRLRRSFFEQYALKYNASAIALGHHADDQQETFFIRLMRGAHLSGLSGMRPRAGNYIRPLLATRKKDILAYLAKNKIEYLEDSSNLSDQFLRNRIRNRVIPILQEADNRFDTHSLRAINHLAEVDDFLECLTQCALEKASILENGIRRLNIPLLKTTHPFMKSKILMQWLIEAKVSFNPSEALLNEITRFIFHPHTSASHTIETWIIHKKNELTWLTVCE